MNLQSQRQLSIEYATLLATNIRQQRELESLRRQLANKDELYTNLHKSFNMQVDLQRATYEEKAQLEQQIDRYRREYGQLEQQNRKNTKVAQQWKMANQKSEELVEQLKLEIANLQLQQSSISFRSRIVGEMDYAQSIEKLQKEYDEMLSWYDSENRQHIARHEKLKQEYERLQQEYFRLLDQHVAT